LRALSVHGLRVPQDVALAGFDDIAMASFVNPPLTTVLQDTRQAGEVLVDSLLRLIRAQPVESAILPAKLIVRRSSLRG
jgi:DNA-binding LacI/PurR family transcriptional regulator